MPEIPDNLLAARARVSAVYDSAALEAAGVRLMGTIADHLRRIESGKGKVLNWNEPGALIRLLSPAGGSVPAPRET